MADWGENRILKQAPLLSCKEGFCAKILVVLPESGSARSLKIILLAWLTFHGINQLEGTRFPHQLCDNLSVGCWSANFKFIGQCLPGFRCACTTPFFLQAEIVPLYRKVALFFIVSDFSRYGRCQRGLFWVLTLTRRLVSLMALARSYAVPLHHPICTPNAKAFHNNCSLKSLSRHFSRMQII